MSKKEMCKLIKRHMPNVLMRDISIWYDSAVKNGTPLTLVNFSKWLAQGKSIN